MRMTETEHKEFFYVLSEHVHGDTLLLTGDEVHHLARVVRKRVGDRAWATDGCGNAYEFELTSVSREAARGRVIQRWRLLGEPAVAVTLAVGLIKGTRFDWLVEKGTEVGVAKFVPMVTARGLLEQSQARVERWRRLALAAMKQCGRTRWPEVAEITPFDEVLGEAKDHDGKFIAHPMKGIAPDFRRGWRSAAILVGPEGGFTEHEVSQALEAGFQPLFLGSRRLRTETAAVIAAAVVLARMGEFD